MPYIVRLEYDGENAYDLVHYLCLNEDERAKLLEGIVMTEMTKYYITVRCGHGNDSFRQSWFRVAGDYECDSEELYENRHRVFPSEIYDQLQPV